MEKREIKEKIVSYYGTKREYFEKLDSVFTDKDYLAECERQRLNCSTPSGGPQVLDFVKKIYASPKEAVEKITAIYQEGQGG